MTRRVLIGMLVLLIWVPFSRAKTFQFTVTKDAGISQAADAMDPTHGPDWRGGGDSSFWVNGYKCWLIGVDLPADLTDASQVQTATLNVNWSTIWQPREFNIFQMNHPWSADPVIGSCWNFWQYEWGWAGFEPRQAKGPALDSETLAPGTNVHYAYNVKAAVQNWLNGDTNYGFLIWSSVSTQWWEARQASASESATPPVFTIEYTVPITQVKTFQFTVKQDAGISQAADAAIDPTHGPDWRGGGDSSFWVNAYKCWLIGVDLPADLTDAFQVQTATLKVNWSTINQPREFNIFQMNHPWSADPVIGSCWNYWQNGWAWAGNDPRQTKGPVLDSETLAPGTNVNYSYNVKAAVQNWLNGDTNYGFLIWSPVSTQWWEARQASASESATPPVFTIEYTGSIRPVFSPGGKYISGPTAITITSPAPNASIYYTLDGTTPTTSGRAYPNPATVTVGNGMTLKAIAAVDGYGVSGICSLTFEVPVSYNSPENIPFGTVTVDGDLSEWTGATWAPMNIVSDVGTSEADVQADVPEACYAARWQANKIYVAVKVHDTGHHFLDAYTAWNVRDAIEVFLHTDNNGATDYSSKNTLAQQYEFGFKTDARSLWAAVGANGVYALSSSPDVAQVAGRVDGEWLYYEIAMTPFTYLGLLETGNMSTTVVSQLFAGQVIGLDVDVVSTNSTGTYLGKKSENDMKPKYNNWMNFGLHKLGALAKTPGDANGDNKVDVSDLGILAANYGTTAGATWEKGDFNGDGKVDVSDLGILAANYGAGTGATLDFNKDAQALGLAVGGEASPAKVDTPVTSGLGCGSAGLPLAVGVLAMGWFMVKLEE